MPGGREQFVGVFEREAFGGRVGGPHAVEQLVLDHDRRPVDRGEERVVDRPGVVAVVEGEHPRPRQAEEVFFQALAVGRPVASTAAHRGPDHQAEVHLVVIHVLELGRVVDDLVGGEGDEVAEHDLADRDHPAQGQAVAQADDGRLGDRHVADPPGELAG